ncbi:GGDEF domain-containing protein [Parahaliea aestuarii]|uniref:diguanylate cyclase n=1 Tax=Parahaliea aestuarii TaxID=1852021 RepID=A0A5C8ZQ23_9GAMM|nr:GGDEF domain-containing protein [Parahaliea aestuarii]TXS90435.1 GGDEF domain-containing protein [Parahaliea aestuarii]
MPDPTELQRRLSNSLRKNVLQALLIMTAVSGVGFAILNIRLNSWPLALAELGMTIYSLFLLKRLRGVESLQRVAILFLIPFFSVMMFALWVPGTSVTIFGWVLVIPLISHLLLGRRTGLAMSLFYMTAASVLFWLRYQQAPELTDPRSLANVTVIAFCVLALSHIYELSRERSEAHLADTARTDFLTGLNNRLGFTEAFERERKRAQRGGSNLALLVMDLDHFKRVNDRYGHDCGDAVLVHVAQLMAERLRDTDDMARLGGEEFGVLLANTDKLQALKVAQALCDAVASQPVHTNGQAIAVTLSAGVATLGADGDDLASLYAAADERLYQAKDAGRNRVQADSRPLSA